jgi:hypothetical protein
MWHTERIGDVTYLMHNGSKIAFYSSNVDAVSICKKLNNS